MNRFYLPGCVAGSLLLAASLESPGESISISHRGLTASAPENTIAAFVAAHGNADMIETDVRVSSDGQLVIMHDPTVDRTTDGTGAVDSLTLAQLRSLDAGSWYSTNFVGQRVPTFAEMITNILPHATPLIEHKIGPASAYVSALQQLGVTTNVMLQSFVWVFLEEVHGLDPKIPLCALGNGTIRADLVAGVIRSGASCVAWEKTAVNATSLGLVHSNGLKLFVWTLASNEIPAYVAMGVDGVITDSPGFAIAYQEPEPDVITASIRSPTPNNSDLVIEAEGKGLVNRYHVLESDAPEGPYVEDLFPVARMMGRTKCLFNYPSTNQAPHFYRVMVD